MPRRKRRPRRPNANIVILPRVLEPTREVEASGQSLTIRVLNPQNQQMSPPSNHQELKVPPPECPTHPENDDEDVTYLYSVSKKSLVEMVDLSEDGAEEPKEGARKFIASGQDFPIEINSNTTAVLQDLRNREISVTCKASTSISIAIGGNPAPAATTLSRKRKRSPSSHATCCTVCQVDYERATNSGNELFHARCGHLFCKQCLHTLTNCIQCKSKIANLWKIYF